MKRSSLNRTLINVLATMTVILSASFVPVMARVVPVTASPPELFPGSGMSVFAVFTAQPGCPLEYGWTYWTGSWLDDDADHNNDWGELVDPAKPSQCPSAEPNRNARIITLISMGVAGDQS